MNEGLDKVDSAVVKLCTNDEVVSEAADGAEEVARATDEQPASTTEVASMVDETAEAAEEVGEIAAANEEQTAKVAEIQRQLDDLDLDAAE